MRENCQKKLIIEVKDVNKFKKKEVKEDKKEYDMLKIWWLGGIMVSLFESRIDHSEVDS